jgi:hypothetical protein
VASTGIVQDTVSLQGPRQSYPGGILATLEIHLQFAADALYTVMGVSDEYWGEVLW